MTDWQLSVTVEVFKCLLWVFAFLYIAGQVVDTVQDERVRLLRRELREAENANGYWKDRATDAERRLEREQLYEGAYIAKISGEAMVAILHSNGGFPAAEGDDVGRQLVREIRAMYAEIQSPTPKPQRRTASSGQDVTDDLLADLDAPDEDEPAAEFLSEEDEL